MSRMSIEALSLANTFSTVLRQWLTAEQMHEVVERNRAHGNERLCASHDFCDANMAMQEAFETVLGREPQAESGEDAELWNEAWTAAKRANFTQIRPTLALD